MRKTPFLILVVFLVLSACGKATKTNQTENPNANRDSSSNSNSNDAAGDFKVAVEMDKSKYPDDLYVLEPFDVSSSGYLKGSNEDYRDDFMIDHDPFTWWTPNPNRDGEGAWIELDFGDEVPVNGFEIWGGSHNPDYPEFGDIYKLNSRVKQGVCEFSDGSTFNFQLLDVDNWQYIRFDSTVYTKTIRLRITETYKGEKWDDLCIAEFFALTEDEELAYYGDGIAKPVIYLYPEKEMEVNVQLDLNGMNGDLGVTYPQYGSNGWDVVANTSGKLIERNTGKEFNYLFWEGNSLKKWKFQDGFVVKGENTAAFLEEKLSYMGLLPTEYNDFIVYWLPKMIDNKYNLIRFPNEEYTRDFPLVITPKPETLLRVFMVFKKLDYPVKLPEQKLRRFTRKGFTVVEWGGSEVPNETPDM